MDLWNRGFDFHQDCGPEIYMKMADFLPYKKTRILTKR